MLVFKGVVNKQTEMASIINTKQQQQQSNASTYRIMKSQGMFERDVVTSDHLIQSFCRYRNRKTPCPMPHSQWVTELGWELGPQDLLVKNFVDCPCQNHSASSYMGTTQSNRRGLYPRPMQVGLRFTQLENSEVRCGIGSDRNREEVSQDSKHWVELFWVQPLTLFYWLLFSWVGCCSKKWRTGFLVPLENTALVPSSLLHSKGEARPIIQINIWHNSGDQHKCHLCPDLV